MSGKTIGDQELTLLKHVAEVGPVSVGQVAEGFGAPRELARSTVLGSWHAVERNRDRAALMFTLPDDGTGLLEWQRLDALVAAASTPTNLTY